eukprot:349916-Chlamydomonas_euryale.AAC.8
MCGGGRGVACTHVRGEGLDVRSATRMRYVQLRTWACQPPHFRKPGTQGGRRGARACAHTQHRGGRVSQAEGAVCFRQRGQCVPGRKGPCIPGRGGSVSQAERGRAFQAEGAVCPRQKGAVHPRLRGPCVPG